MSDRFVCKATSFEIIDGDERKAPQVAVQLQVIEGPESGRMLSWFGSLHENAQQYTAEALRNMGWNCNDITALTGLGSTKVHAVAKQSEYMGKVRTQYMIFGFASRNTLPRDAKASFAKQYKALAASVKPIEVTDSNRVPSSNGAGPILG